MRRTGTLTFGGTRAMAKTAAHWRRLALAIFAIAMILALVSPYFADPVDLSAPGVENGAVDYSRFGQLERAVELKGKWRVTWLAGDGAPPGATATAPVPGPWTGLRTARGGALPLLGLARYEVRIAGLRPGYYTIHVPAIYSASRVLIDGVDRSDRGRVTTSAAGARYDVRAHNVPFATDGGPVVIGLEIASWIHHDNGLIAAPVIGDVEAMNRWGAVKWSGDTLYNGCILLVAALAITIFLFRQSDRAPLYLGLGCIFLLPAVSIIGYDNLLVTQLPWLKFQWMMTLQYLTFSISICLFLANAHALFPSESPRSVMRVAVGLFTLFTLRQAWAFWNGRTLDASNFQQWPLLLIAATLIYIVVIVARGTWRRREGAPTLLVGVAAFVTALMTELAINVGWITSDQIVRYDVSAAGVLLLLFSHVVLMAERWSLATARAEQTSDELRQLLDVNTAITSDLQLGSLLEKIVQVTGRIIRADRSSLFLKDERSDELASLVAEGVGEHAIRFDKDSGLAGDAFARNEVVNVADAYADARFNRAIDSETGYRTRSVLSVPISARDGRTLGVMQALNRLDGRPFDEDDIARISAFGAQAAIAIDNARLFTEVVAARNFDDSILRSMSGGVIALDGDWTITKVNAAAAAILGVGDDELLGDDARARLRGRNDWLIDEIAAVVDTGEPKLLLDADLATATRTASVNLSIAPLQGEAGQIGMLILMEDISEGKRMQSAMRRFMTQQVVDQVLGRDDDLLFGTACEASVLFADIRGFTTLAEALSARATVEMLNELFTELFEAIAAAGGVLDKYIGDAIMAVFGAPLPSGRDPQNAVRSGIDMLRLLDALNARRAERDAPPIRLGIGIATGEVIAGTIGSPKRMDYTVIGDSANLASRLQDLTRTYGVDMLVCEKTAAAIDCELAVREIDVMRVRGRQRPEKIFAVQALAGDPAVADALGALYAEGRARLGDGDWAAAIAAFEQALTIDPKDGPSRVMLQRARSLADDPMANGGDVVWRAPAKG